MPRTALAVSELTFGCMIFGEGDYYGMKYTINQEKANALAAERFKL